MAVGSCVMTRIVCHNRVPRQAERFGSRQGLLFRDRELLALCRDRKGYVATRMGLGLSGLGCDREHPVRTDFRVAHSARAPEHNPHLVGHHNTRQSVQCARQRVLCTHCAHDQTATVHCLGHCTWTLFTNTVQERRSKKKKKEYKNDPLGIRGIASWYQS